MGGGGWHKASASDCLPLAAPIGLSPLLILTLRGPERVLVVSTEPPDDLSCLTTPGVGCPGDGAVARAVDQVHPDAPKLGVGGCYSFEMKAIFGIRCPQNTVSVDTASLCCAFTLHAARRKSPLQPVSGAHILAHHIRKMEGNLW